MKPLRIRLQETRKRTGLPWEVIERDYLLSWILAGIDQVDSLRETLVFKGGTALKKCYFGDYRFSEDLDFSGVGDVPAGNAMEGAVREACVAAAKLLDEYTPIEIVCERYTEKEPPKPRVSPFSRLGEPFHLHLQSLSLEPYLAPMAVPFEPPIVVTLPVGHGELRKRAGPLLVLSRSL